MKQEKAKKDEDRITFVLYILLMNLPLYILLMFPNHFMILWFNHFEKKCYCSYIFLLYPNF